MEGHADERGTREYNFALGARRAQAARDYLASRGVNASRIKTISYGKERPVAVCDDISCWSQNRRAVTVLGGAAGILRPNRRSQASSPPTQRRASSAATLSLRMQPHFGPCRVPC